MSNWLRVLIVIGVVSGIASPALAAYECLQYDIVSLTGTLARQTYPGPPDYESVTKGDEPRVIWVLLLDSRICVVGPNPSYPREYNEREVQLVLSDEHARQYQTLLGERVIATGKLFHGGASYDKRLVLSASEIKRTSVYP